MRQFSTHRNINDHLADAPPLGPVSGLGEEAADGGAEPR
jgi:hypothetical protein